MDHRKILGIALSALFGVVCWALSEIVEPLSWLPYISLPVAGTLALLLVAMLWFDHQKATRRVSMPGFGVHLGIRISDIQERRRQYIFELGPKSKPGAAFYLSSSRRFVFEIRDANGEPYSVEVPAGWLGVPIADPVYLILEAGTDGIGTVMRIAVNGRTVGERSLPFKIDFGGLTVKDLTIGANNDKRENGGFVLNSILMLDRTLDHGETTNMLHYMAERTGVQPEV